MFDDRPGDPPHPSPFETSTYHLILLRARESTNNPGDSGPNDASESSSRGEKSYLPASGDPAQSEDADAAGSRYGKPSR